MKKNIKVYVISILVFLSIPFYLIIASNDWIFPLYNKANILDFALLSQKNLNFYNLKKGKIIENENLNTLNSIYFNNEILYKLNSINLLNTNPDYLSIPKNKRDKLGYIFAKNLKLEYNTCNIYLTEYKPLKDYNIKNLYEKGIKHGFNMKVFAAYYTPIYYWNTKEYNHFYNRNFNKCMQYQYNENSLILSYGYGYYPFRIEKNIDIGWLPTLPMYKNDTLVFTNDYILDIRVELKNKNQQNKVIDVIYKLLNDIDKANKEKNYIIDLKKYEEINI